MEIIIDNKLVTAQCEKCMSQEDIHLVAVQSEKDSNYEYHAFCQDCYVEIEE